MPLSEVNATCTLESAKNEGKQKTDQVEEVDMLSINGKQ